MLASVIAGHSYGSTFFMATGFHGAHVIIGTIFLAVCLVRAMRGAFTPQQHFGFEAAAWYWHFVDVVWLFLFAASMCGALEPVLRLALVTNGLAGHSIFLRGGLRIASCRLEWWWRARLGRGDLPRCYAGRALECC